VPDGQLSQIEAPFCFWKKPTAQGVQTEALAVAAKVPTGHASHAGFPTSSSNLPALQFAHALDDCKLNCPALHWSAIDDVEPGGHTYPAVQFPEHDDVVRPDVAPYFPASHGPEQLAVVRPGVAPYSPALQLLHTPAPATLKVPAGHMTAVADTDPVAHAYPGVHSPEQLADGRPAEPPYVPAGHGVAEGRDDPAGQ
jgi:hypothetical protein